MEPTICARCKKNVAVIFITRIEGNESRNEGLCLKCARELHIKPVDDIISKMGLSDEDLDSLQGDMSTMLGEGLAALQQAATDADADSDDDDEGKTATFPFLSRLMGQSGANGGDMIPAEPPRASESAPHAPGKENGRGAKKKFLDSYCINLTDRARSGKLDAMIGRAE